MSTAARPAPEQEDQLWRQALASFEAHRQATDVDAQAALNRIARKCRGVDELRSFDPASCTIGVERLSQTELGLLKTFHTRSRPLREFEPIVVLEIDGVRYVIEGNTRVNKWIAEQPATTRAAIILKPKAA